MSGHRAWLRALELTAPIASQPKRTLPIVIEELAARTPRAPALFTDGEGLTFGALAARARQYARWALDHGVAPGDVVALFMPNRPEYMAIWLGLTRVGGVVALLNTNLTGPSLAHSIATVAPRHIVADARLLDALLTARPDGTAKIWVHGATDDAFASIDRDVATYAGDPLGRGEAPAPTLDDRALHIFTSGTTGWPKAANVSHFRLMQWSHWFAGLMDVRPSDRMYNCLPMYHSVGGVVATGAALVAGGSVVVRERFSARQFWHDVVRWDCTLVQYIGELCRYLLHTAPQSWDTWHRVRLACGNGLRADVWTAFQERFRIPRILEFYASTEGNVSLFNVDGTPGVIGRIPKFLAHRAPVALVKVDVATETPVRDANGCCVPCEPNEPGEALGKITGEAGAMTRRFEGYTSAEASERKILRDVFEPGDAWFRTGDLMRRDADGAFTFVDRLGDTFRWKGENVATCEVAEALGECPGVTDAIVYGVAVPGTEGRAGMAALVADDTLDLGALRAHLTRRLPDYARPRFLRLCPALAVTATFKHAKHELAREGFDPGATNDALYVDDLERGAFVRIDAAVHARIIDGTLRL